MTLGKAEGALCLTLADGSSLTLGEATEDLVDCRLNNGRKRKINKKFSKVTDADFIKAAIVFVAPQKMKTTMFSLVLLGVATIASAQTSGAPTMAPTKSEAEIKMLAECANSRSGGADDVFEEPEATKERQLYRNGYFNFKNKLDKFDFDMQKMMDDPTGDENKAFAQLYFTALAWSTLWPAILLVLGVLCCFPCWIVKVRTCARLLG